MTVSNSPLGLDTQFGFLDRAIKSQQLYNPTLIANYDHATMLQAIREELRRSKSFTFSVAFISSRGIALLKQALVDFEGTGEIITSRYLDFNDPAMFRELLLLENVQVNIHEDAGFHSKGYVFEQDTGITAIIGSSNLTDNALLVNQEWNLKFSADVEGDIAFQLHDAAQKQCSRSVPLTEQWIQNYEKSRRVPDRLIHRDDPIELSADGGRIVPNEMQEEALEGLRELRDRGERRAVIISATGTGKTILAALATRMFNPEKVLFIVHREQILDKAVTEFQKVLKEPSDHFGKFVGSSRQFDRKYIFATVQSLSRRSTLDALDPAEFDFVIIDEVHRSGAESYRRIINHLAPEFLLGLTATPERTDGFNVFELFDYNVPYEIRLQAALEAKMLVPFHYYGVTDFVTADDETVTDTSQLARLVADERVSYILDMLRTYGHPEAVKGLMFCSRKDEAHELSTLFNQSIINGHRLRTAVLTGDDSIQDREATVEQLEAGELDYILSVDIFNEGIDIPLVNQVVMLRGTQSSIIFTQQLGRGLRKAPGKDHLRVIDFIGNYANNYLIPIALFGDNSRNKDSIRRRMIDNETAGTISGVSSVNFDPIAQNRILESLGKARLVGKQQFKQDILQLQDRLNQIPKLYDFARFNTVDPVILASKYGNYWRLLTDLKFAESGPSEEEEKFLVFLSNEVLNGKRPHELLLLNELLEHGELSRAEFASLLDRENTVSNVETMLSVERVLSYSFFSSQQLNKYGDQPVLRVDEDRICLGEKFSDLYHSPAQAEDRTAEKQSFHDHVNDIIQTGLFLARHQHAWRGELLIGERYSRKDVCRLLNWEKNNESTIYGYKVDQFTSTCPIFVTYHKDDEVSASTSYEDEFKGPDTLHWYTRSRRTLSSGEVQAITSNSVALHLFVKKDDAEGTDFFYLGEAQAENEVQEQMPGNDGAALNVVSMDLTLETPVEQSLYEYLSTLGATSAS
ncbi:DUF3427 domain-containing protein [Corynebacterium halotolerans]|uniref:Helicase n=1 Tax=Corynebacterium halotolerans YIM 70093 = DSM 44683 TaxID=1121362 RepID=M1NXF3_9CORY|nr:DEAD/DEAH box helicase [Corynebacterium halotolerans]AGF72175.1 hypothetical protein A605_05845 [Corynebacterium halotolerans YIM 70093 = DSM 44683]